MLPYFNLFSKTLVLRNPHVLHTQTRMNSDMWVTSDL